MDYNNLLLEIAMSHKKSEILCSMFWMFHFASLASIDLSLRDESWERPKNKCVCINS